MLKKEHFKLNFAVHLQEAQKLLIRVEIPCYVYNEKSIMFKVGWEKLEAKLWSLKALSASQAGVGGILAGAAAAVFLAHRFY